MVLVPAPTDPLSQQPLPLPPDYLHGQGAIDMRATAETVTDEGEGRPDPELGEPGV